MRGESWHRAKGQDRQQHLWQRKGHTDYINNLIYRRDYCSGLLSRMDSWHEYTHLGISNIYYQIWRHHAAFTAINRNDDDGTPTTSREVRLISGGLKVSGYLTNSESNEAVTLSKDITLVFLCSWLSVGHQEMDNQGNMDTGSCRGKFANQELQSARSIYETRSTTRNKRRIADMEVAVKEEERSRTEEDIAREVDWLTDPGTTAGRATQFVRTQVECWRIKTLLARALESKDEGNQQSRGENPISEAQLKDLYEICEALDDKIAAVHEVAKIVNKNLTLLIKLLRQTLSPDPPSSAGKQKETPKEIHNYRSLQERADKHILEQGLDIASRFGMPPQ